MKLRTCLICECTSAGTAVQFRRRDICTHCEASLLASGRAWCAYGKHAVPAATMRATSSRCKPCDAARDKAYQAGRDRRAYAKAYRAANADTLRAYFARPEVKARRAEAARRRYRDNPAPARARERLRYARNVTTRRALARKAYWRNPTAHRAYQARRKVERKLAILRTWRGG